MITPNLMERRTHIISENPDRSQPVYLRNAYLDVDEIVYVIPEGFRVEALPAKVSSEFEYGYYKTEYEVNEIDNKLIYRRTLMMKPGVLPAGKFENFRAYMNNITIQDAGQAIIAPISNVGGQ